MNVALVGFGTVGRSVARLLLGLNREEDGAQPAGIGGRHERLRLTHVFNRDIARKRVDWVPADVVWTERFEDVLASPADAIVEVVGGREPAGGWIRQALERGKHVVTANKQLMAHEGANLAQLALRHGRHLAFEAAVAGGIPVIRALSQGIAGDRLLRVSGILNGTCNYMLTRMASSGSSFAEALGEAQARGFAEIDPTDDVDGYDARAKLCILARVGLHQEVRPDEVSCRSIRRVSAIDFAYARRLECTIRQVSRAELDPTHGTLVAWVQPALVPRGSPLARVEGAQNLVVATGEYGGDTVYSGFGAGGGPTAVAVVSDLVAIAGAGPPGLAGGSMAARPTSVTDRFPSRHYLRFVVGDRPGIIASLATTLSSHGINIDAILQEPGMPKEALPFVITLEECDPHVLAGAMMEMERLDFHVAAPVAMPMLD